MAKEVDPRPRERIFEKAGNLVVDLKGVAEAKFEVVPKASTSWKLMRWSSHSANKRLPDA